MSLWEHAGPWRSIGGLTIVALLHTPISASAQEVQENSPSDLVVGISNAAIGGVTAGLARLVKGEPVWPGFIRGASGGVVHFLGKVVVAREGSGNAWIGRQLAAIGTSEINNAASSRPVLSSVVLPAGLIRIRFKTRTPALPLIKLDLAASLATLVAASASETDFDLRESVRNGAVVFLLPDTPVPTPGKHVAGVLRVANIPPSRANRGSYTRAGVLAHEMVHATQYDFVSQAWGASLDAWVISAVPHGSKILRFVDLGIMVPVWLLVNGAVEKQHRPWEKEALALNSGR